MLLFILCNNNLHAQEPDEKDFEDAGISVSPSSMHLKIKPGTTEVKEIKVKNFTRKKYSFSVFFNDFEMTDAGKPATLPHEKRRYGLSKFIGVSPSFFELNPGEEIKVKLSISIPDDEEGYRAMWTIVAIDQVVERPPIDPSVGSPDRLALGVIPTFGIGVYVYQNPPDVIVNKLEIESLKFDRENNIIVFSVKNIGDGISYCISFLELSNINTGEQYKLDVKRFVILPQYSRVFSYRLPSDIKPGHYSAIGVIDYGDKEEIIAAEIEFDI